MSMSVPSLIVDRRGGRPAPSGVAATDAPKVPKGQPTWCIRITCPAARLPGGLDPNGERVHLPSGVPVRLRRAGFDDAGREVWEVPADQWWCGDVIRIGPTDPGVVIQYGIYPPNTSNSYWKTRSA